MVFSDDAVVVVAVDIHVDVAGTVAVAIYSAVIVVYDFGNDVDGVVLFPVLLLLPLLLMLISL